MNSLLSSIKNAVSPGGALHTALDSMDTKLDGVIDLNDLSDKDTGLLAKLFTIDTVDGDGRNLLTKLDALDGKVDGLMDLDRMELMSIFFDSGASKPRLQLTVENLDGTIGTLKTSIDELVGVHTDTGKMVDFALEDFSGSVGPVQWSLCSSASAKRNMLKITNTGGSTIEISRDNGSTSAGYIDTGSDVTVYDSPGVWLQGYGGDSTWDAHEEWAT